MECGYRNDMGYSTTDTYLISTNEIFMVNVKVRKYEYLHDNPSSPIPLSVPKEAFHINKMSPRSQTSSIRYLSDVGCYIGPTSECWYLYLSDIKMAYLTRLCWCRNRISIPRRTLDTELYQIYINPTPIATSSQHQLSKPRRKFSTRNITSLVILSSTLWFVSSCFCWLSNTLHKLMKIAYSWHFLISPARWHHIGSKVLVTIASDNGLSPGSTKAFTDPTLIYHHY